MSRYRNGILTHVASVTAMLAVATCSSSLCAQTPDAASDFPYQAVVLEDELYVRCGGGEAFYPFGQIGRGDIVTVTDERFGWARVQTSGPAFKDMFGYVQADDIRLESDRASGLTLGKVQIFAPNAYRDMAPEASWRPIGDIAPERTVVILGTVTAGDDAFHKIVLPGACEGWVSARYLRRASEKEVAEWASREFAAAEPREIPAADEDSAVDSSDDSQTSGESNPSVETVIAEIPAIVESEDVTVEPLETIDDSTADMMAANEVDADPMPGDVLARAEPNDIEVIDMPDLQESKDPTAEMDAATIEDLESAYEKLKAVPIRNAEIETLRNQYQQALEEGNLDRRGTAVAKARVQLLDARLQLQLHVRKLDAVRVRSTQSTEVFEAARINIEAATRYTAVGRITVSTIFDGERLPRLLRLVDTGTGRTIVYIKPDGMFDDATMIDQVIGVVGTKRYDEGLRLNVIDPKRIDLLATARTVRSSG